MQKDWEIGIVVGLVSMAVVAVWLATRPSLSIKSRMRHSYSVASRQKYMKQPGFAPDSPNSWLPTTALANKTGQAKFPTATDKPREPDELKLTETPLAEQGEKIKTQKFHIICKGETLSDISYKYYGSANKWRKLFDANRNVLEDANKLREGTKLIIPE